MEVVCYNSDLGSIISVMVFNVCKVVSIVMEILDACHQNPSGMSPDSPDVSPSSSGMSPDMSPSSSGLSADCSVILSVSGRVVSLRVWAVDGTVLGAGCEDGGPEKGVLASAV